MEGGTCQVARDMSLQKFSCVVQGCIDELSGGACLQYSTFKDDLTLDKFWFFVQNLKEVIKKVIIENPSKEEILEQYSDVGNERASVLFSSVDAQRHHLQNVMAQESVAEEKHLKDFDWNIRVCVASDKVLDLNEVLLTLHLHTATASGKDSTITEELTLAQVDQLIGELKSCEEELLQISKT